MMKLILLILCILCSAVHAGEAPGKPGQPPHWASAQKIAVGTSYEAYDLDGNYSPLSETAPISKVWFTIAQGILTETYFPTIDAAQTQSTELLISDGKTFIEEEKNGIHSIERLDDEAPLFRVTTQDHEGRYTLIKDFFTHPESQHIFIQYSILPKIPGLHFYLAHNPRANNSGYHDTGLIEDNQWIAHEKNYYQVISTSLPLTSSVGFVGTSDGQTELSQKFSFTPSYDKAKEGHIRFVGEIPLSKTTSPTSFTIVLGFGFSKEEVIQKTKEALSQNSDALKKQYVQEWHSYFNKLLNLSSLSHDQGQEFYTSTLLLKSHEDKTYPGAIVASLSVPWGDQNSENSFLKNLFLYAEDRGTGGYHLVWPRDLFQTARALMSLHDFETAKNCLKFLKRIQHTQEDGLWSFDERNLSKKGSFPQSTWVDGTSFWQGLQMDEVSFPIILAWHLWQAGEIAISDYWPMIEQAANFITQFGPWTSQERWEENYGISPSTVAAEISALVCEADFAEAKGAQEESRIWLQTADQWSLTPGNNIEAWTFTTSGLWGNGRYYLRLDGASRFSASDPDYLAVWDPNDNKNIFLANFSGTYLEKEIIDGGFLELVRYGVRSPTNEFILDSLAELDEKIKVITPQGPAWYRYLYDGYGEEGRGRLWTFLTGERAQYELALQLKRKANPKVIINTLDQYIKTLEGFSNEGYLFSEQLWDKDTLLGHPTGSATPLLWTHAEYLKLLRAKADQKPFELIPIVYQRYKDY